jgi:hypothetical protein
MNRFTLRRLLIVVPIAGALLGIVGSWLYRESNRGWSAARLERSIQAESPPIATEQQAAKWFEANKIDYQVVGADGGYQIGNQYMTQIAGYSSAQVDHVVRGGLRDAEANLGLFSNGWIHIFFFIDSNGNCLGHYIYEFVYAL